ncbi:MAG: hypothetical protein NC117_10865 [Pseudoflavonifractor sp.]|nr:hypothetical protein [Pseudoflavonifractor sp.]
MKQKISIIAISLSMAFATLTSCGRGVGEGDARDRNIGNATLAYLDSIANVEYVGLADTHVLDDGRFQAVVIYYVADSIGNKTERNARLTTNGDGSEILAWEDLDSRVLSDAKQKISDKMEEKGVNLDGSLIDALIELKKQTR